MLGVQRDDQRNSCQESVEKSLVVGNKPANALTLDEVLAKEHISVSGDDQGDQSAFKKFLATIQQQQSPGELPSSNCVMVSIEIELHVHLLLHILNQTLAWLFEVAYCFIGVSLRKAYISSLVVQMLQSQNLVCCAFPKCTFKRPGNLQILPYKYSRHTKNNLSSLLVLHIRLALMYIK